MADGCDLARPFVTETSMMFMMPMPAASSRDRADERDADAHRFVKSLNWLIMESLETFRIVLLPAAFASTRRMPRTLFHRGFVIGRIAPDQHVELRHERP